MPTGSLRFTHPSYAEPDLFIVADHTLFDSSQGAALRYLPLEKHGQPVMHLNEPWEGGDGHHASPEVHKDPPVGSILWDNQEKRYVFWYTICNRRTMLVADPALGPMQQPRMIRPEGSGVAIAHSQDGLSWTKPQLDIVPFQGSALNNMIRIDTPPVMGDHLSGVVPNFLPEAKTDLVATVFSRFDDALYAEGITQLHSSDGLAWSPVFPPTLPLDGDAHCLMWDPRRECYLCTTRSMQHRRVISRLRARYPELTNKRHVALAMSRDLVNWTPMLDILDADEEDGPKAQMYMMYILPYGHAYLGFVQMFYMEPTMTHGPLDVQLAISTDLANWHRIPGRPAFIPRGEAGSWDASHITMCNNPPFAEGDRLRFWFGGKDTEHWQAGVAALSTGTIRRDGFACWEAGERAGSVTTVPMQLTWATWPMLNVDATAGQVRVEILDEDGQPIPGCSAQDCVPITGNHLRAPLRFNSDADTFIRHTGKVRLRFHLQNARLYAFKLPNVRPCL